MWTIDHEHWGLSVRANVRLWPTPTPLIRHLVTRAGLEWDEDELAAGLKGDGPRAVRQTFEVLARVGLVYRDRKTREMRLTELGQQVFEFLGEVGAGRCVPNDANRALLATILVPALAQVIEYHAIWAVMCKCDYRLSNEELNRVMTRLTQPSDIEETAQAVLDSRASGDPILIGARIYEDSRYLTAPESQRRAITPVFGRVSAGGILMDRGPGESRIISSVTAAIQGAVSTVKPHIHASTDALAVLTMSDAGVHGRAAGAYNK